MASAATAANPHQGVQERVSLIASFHGQVDAILVATGVNAIGHAGVIDLLQYILCASKPALGLDNNESRRLIGSLEQVVGAQVGG